MSIEHVFYADRRVPWWLQILGCFDREKRNARFRWGEFSARWGLTLELCLFGDPEHYSLHVLPIFGQWFIKMPFGADREPHAGMESWGFSWRWFDSDGSTIHLRWGKRSRVLWMPWHWKHHSHEILLKDGSWREAKRDIGGAWDSTQDPLPDVHVETHPYHYLLDNGEVQHVTATVTVERRTWRRMKRVPWPRKVRRSIDVWFNSEVGERVGSWKGGCLGCGYEMRPGETPRHALRRMQRERRFR